MHPIAFCISRNIVAQAPRCLERIESSHNVVVAHCFAGVIHDRRQRVLY